METFANHLATFVMEEMEKRGDTRALNGFETILGSQMVNAGYATFRDLTADITSNTAKISELSLAIEQRYGKVTLRDFVEEAHVEILFDGTIAGKHGRWLIYKEAGNPDLELARQRKRTWVWDAFENQDKLRDEV